MISSRRDRHRGVAAALTALGVIASAHACSQATDDTADQGPSGPPAICKPAAVTPAKWLTDATADVGLATTDSFKPLGQVLIAADLDGDGFADILSMSVTAERVSSDPNWAGKQLRFLFMNRPDPNDAKRRIFVDAIADSGLLTTRDGKGNRGFTVANFGDLDNDGDVDAVLCNANEIAPGGAKVDDPCDAMLNDGKGHFKLAPESDLDKKVVWVPGAVLFDYDRDGVLDFWPAEVAHWPYNPADPNTPATLYRGNGDGTFTDVSAAVGLPQKDGTLKNNAQWRHTFGNVACDLDGDGDDDMVLASYGREENWVFRNDNGHFVEVGQALGIAHDDREDYSDDQSFRCYCAVNPQSADCVAKMPPKPDVPQCADAFGPGSGPYFRGWQPGVTTQPWTLGGNYFTIACGDIDDDGDMDLFSATIVHGDVGSSADPSEIILNPGNGGKFTRPGNVATGLDRPEKGVYWNHGESMSLIQDIDLDGRKDLMVTETGAYGPDNTAALWHQKSDGKFEEVSGAIGLIDAGTRNFNIPLWVDVDGDGDLDFVTSLNTGKSLPPTTAIRVYRNDVADKQNLIRVRLDGGTSHKVNRSAIGAIVRVTAGGRTQTQYVSGGFGHGNVQNDLVLTFGLGSACAVDNIEVRWPDASATRATFANVVANYGVTLTYGSSEVAYRALGAGK